MTDTEARLARIRGRALPRSHNARTIAALASNPGCARRAILDAAGADKQRIAAYTGFPAPFGQSRFALSRGNAFEAQVKADGGAELPRRDGAVSAARRLANMERVQEMVAAQHAFDDPLVMAEYRMAGHAFAGQVIAAEQDRVDATGPRRVLRPRITVETGDADFAGQDATLTSPARPNQKARVLAVTPVGDRIRMATKAADLAGCPVVLSTAHKWATVRVDATWPWAIVDEAYQMRSDLLLLLRHNPDVPVHVLPVSWRLPESAAPVVAEAFYPFTGFRAATAAEQRRVEFSTRSFGKNALDLAVETAAASGWALYELAARHSVRTDAEAVAACAALAMRLVQRGALSYSERAVAGVPVDASRIAVGTAHRDQAQAIRVLLVAAGLPEITVDTANRLQGREFDIVVVLHPLSGRRDATAFHLEAGRLCVLTSRHRHACIVVARAGIPELLDAHPSTEPVHLNVPVKFPDGWEAHQSVLAHLSQFKVRAS